MFVSRAKEKGNRAGLLFVRRLLILMLFGAVHQYFQPGESLLIYAIIGFLLLPFYRVKPTIVLWLGIIFTAMGCYLGYPVLILGMFLLGHWTGSIGLFQYTERYLRGLRITQFTALLLIVPLYFVQESIMDYTGSPDISLAVGGLPVSLFYVTTLTVLMQREKVQRLLVPLGNLGRMALTNYLMQTVIILTLAHVLDWHDSVHQLTLMMAAVAILIVQMICSSLWLKYFRMGPVEYLWRLGTYGKAFPNYKRVNTD